jgi:hypothetical protein
MQTECIGIPGFQGQAAYLTKFAAEMKPRAEVVRDIVLPYALKPWQKKVKNDPHRFKTIVAGSRSGKTTLAVDWLVTAAPTDDMRIGDSMSWYIGPSYTSAEDIAWGKLKENIRPLQDHGLIRRIYEGDMSIEFIGGQWIQLKGGDKPDSLRGVKLRRLVLDEFAIMKREVWEEALAPRTSDYLAPVMFISTPKSYNHFYDLAQMESKNPRDWKTFYVKTSEAGTISPEEIERARRDMDPRVFRQEYEASFEAFGGQVFTDFSREIHVAKAPIKFNPAMEYCLGIDFGWSAPTVVLFINVDAQENVFVWKELLKRETPISAIGKHIIDAAPARPTLIGCDPAGDAKNEALGTSSVSELRVIFGYNVVKYKHKYPGVIQDRINQIRKWLRNKKLIFSPDCPHIIQAMEMYRYPDPKGDIQSELPLKDGISDHPIDALGEFFINRFPVRKSSCGVA